MQCAAGAAAAVGTASGIRAYLAMKAPAWFTPAIAKVTTGVLLTGALLAAGLIGA